MAPIMTGKEEEGSFGRPKAIEEEGIVTPRAEENRMKPAVECPPAPRKSRLAKRKVTPGEGYFKVPRDLASVFVGLRSKKLKSIG
ncbi:hypothetical protein HPP92_004242 [Vanilla planifolia]|nr:hypothetical protein HPP92_004680 [Vanilla planifolia]KAG0493248.1 hypothetical protein HPP92_004242 [Vanilla planifolia]